MPGRHSRRPSTEKMALLESGHRGRPGGPCFEQGVKVFGIKQRKVKGTSSREEHAAS